MNPIVQTKFTADPAPVVFKDNRYSDRLFLYTTNDAPGADWFVMDNLLCFSSTDLVNWSDHGIAMNSADFTWAKKNTLWAPQIIDRNGMFYAYVPIEIDGRGPQIGVGISRTPFGPFKDAIGKPLIEGNWNGDIDPTVFIDDDGQAYLYWGNPQLKYVKLKENMIELDGEVVHVPMTEESFGHRVGGPSKEGKWPTAYEEGPWLNKRNVEENPYYLIFAGGQLPEHIGYSRAASPVGPWHYGGMLMPSQEGTAFTIHPGVVDYKGKSYFFYHCQRLTGLKGFTGGFTRSVSVEEFSYNPDGSISEIPMTKTGPDAVAALNPYEKVSAATINWCEGVLTQRKEPDNRSNLEMCIFGIHNNSYVKIKNVDFGTKGPAEFKATISCGNNNGDIRLELRIGDINGKLIGALQVAFTGGWDEWAEQSLSVENIHGVQDLYLVFKSGSHDELVRICDWQFF